MQQALCDPGSCDFATDRVVPVLDSQMLWVLIGLAILAGVIGYMLGKRHGRAKSRAHGDLKSLAGRMKAHASAVAVANHAEVLARAQQLRKLLDGELGRVIAVGGPLGIQAAALDKALKAPEAKPAPATPTGPARLELYLPGQGPTPVEAKAPVEPGQMARDAAREIHGFWSRVTARDFEDAIEDLEDALSQHAHGSGHGHDDPGHDGDRGHASHHDDVGHGPATSSGHEAEQSAPAHRDEAAVQGGGVFGTALGKATH